MSPSLDVVFFDVHDTLIYQSVSPPEIFRRLCAEAEIDVEREQVERAYPSIETLQQRADAFDGDTDDYWRAFNAELLDKLELPDPDGSLAEHLMTGFKRADWWTAFDDALPTLTALREAGFRLGTIANARGLIMGRLHKTGLLEGFDAITYSEEVGYAKPDKRLFDVALGRLNVLAANAVHIGDRWREDVQGARGAGLRPILIDRADDHPNVECDRIRRLDELPELLAR